jgi:hypothetical protein
MIPLSSPYQSEIVIVDMADAPHGLLLSKVGSAVMIVAEFHQRARLETCKLFW